MQAISYAHFLDNADTFDEIALNSDGIDGYCSSSRWVVPAFESFAQPMEPFVLAGEYGFGAFTRFRHPEVGMCLMPLDATWGLGCPLVLRQTHGGMAEFRAALGSCLPWDAAVVSGIDPESYLFQIFRFTLGSQYLLRRISETKRVIASLEGGLDGFLSRRTRKFRANLRKASQRAQMEGLTFHRTILRSNDSVDAVYPTLMQIEGLSWKAQAGEGVDRDPMKSFIRMVLQRGTRNDQVMLILAQRNGAVVGYLHGSLCRRGFRGLQMSYDERLAPMAIGNLLQLSMLQWLCEENSADTYDLGSELEYKRAWGERTFTTWTVLTTRG